MIKRIFSFLLVLSLVSALAGCVGQAESKDDASPQPATEIETADVSKMDFSFSARDCNPSYDASTANLITYNETADVSGSGAKADRGDVEITAEGTYILSGTGKGKITVEAADTAKLTLVLAGITLSASDGPAIYIKSADKVFITLADGSENTVADGDSYSVTDGDSTLDAAIFSRADLCINGGGSLTVKGNYKHGIVSKDDLITVGATLDVTAQNVGLCGKDCLKLKDADITVSAGTDGLRSDNTEDSARGFIYSVGTTLGVTAGNDGLQAETAVKIDDGDINIVCGGGSGNAVSSAGNNSFGGRGFGKNGEQGFGEQPTDTDASDSTESAKAIKAASDILISGGNYCLDSADDCIHSNNTVIISDGVFSLKSGDDGIHADNSLSVTGGYITVEKSYEGLEASTVSISGGEIKITSSDDGLNAAGGADSSALGGRLGQGTFARDGGEISISGGRLFVSADGDGLDSNGSLYISGGVVLCSGPANSGNGALDYESECRVSGGTVVALGSSGMASGFTETDGVGGILCSFDTQDAGTSFALCDENGKALVFFESKKSYSSAAVASPFIESGKTYTVRTGGTADTDSLGFAENVTVSGGTDICDIEMTALLYSQGGGMKGPGSMGGHRGQ